MYKWTHAKTHVQGSNVVTIVFSCDENFYDLLSEQLPRLHSYSDVARLVRLAHRCLTPQLGSSSVPVFPIPTPPEY